MVVELSGPLIHGGSEEEAHLRLMELLAGRHHLTTEPHLLLRDFNALLAASLESSAGWVSYLDAVTAALSGLLARAGVEVDEEERGWLCSEYLTHYRSFVRLQEGAREVLETLRGTGLHIALLADADRDLAEKQTTWLSLCGLFDSLTTTDEVGARMPDPRLLKVALAKAGCRASEAIFVGRRPGGHLSAAKALGMTTILLDVDRNASELEDVDFVASHMNRVGNIALELAHGPPRLAPSGPHP